MMRTFAPVARAALNARVAAASIITAALCVAGCASTRPTPPPPSDLQRAVWAMEREEWEQAKALLDEIAPPIRKTSGARGAAANRPIALSRD